MSETPRTIRFHVEERARSQPEAVYLVAPETGRELSYARLHQASASLATFLRGMGLRKGDKVGLMMHNGYQTARLLLGVMYGGYVVVPINLLSQPSQLEYVLDHSDVQVIFTAPEFVDALNKGLEKVRRTVRVLTIDPDADTAFDEPEAGALPWQVHEDDDALLMYTSGTTGMPKGVILTHRNVVAGGEFTTSAHALTESDRVMCALPLYHINGQIVTTVAPLVHGGSVVMPRRFSVSGYWETVSRLRCTWINVVPTIIAYLVNAGPPAGMDLSRVRFCRSASAPLSPDLHREFEAMFGIGIIETFGMTETCAPCFSNPLDPSRRKIGSPGPPWGNEGKVIDPGTGATLPPGRAGELMVRGDNVMTGYYKAADITAKTLEPDGWMHTGDLGYMDEDGFVFVTGRLKELIIKGGENIAPREIDEALLRHPAVLEAAAVGIPDRNYGQEIMACVVLKADCECSCEELERFCREELGPYKTPRTIRFVEALPKGPSGKVQRLKLLEMVPQRA